VRQEEFPQNLEHVLGLQTTLDRNRQELARELVDDREHPDGTVSRAEVHRRLTPESLETLDSEIVVAP
jgi:hypothetical protein